MKCMKTIRNLSYRMVMLFCASTDPTRTCFRSEKAKTYDNAQIWSCCTRYFSSQSLRARSCGRSNAKFISGASRKQRVGSEPREDWRPLADHFARGAPGVNLARDLNIQKAYCEWAASESWNRDVQTWTSLLLLVRSKLWTNKRLQGRKRFYWREEFHCSLPPKSQTNVRACVALIVHFKSKVAMYKRKILSWLLDRDLHFFFWGGGVK